MSKEAVNQVMIFTAETDVVVIATSIFSELSLLELWIEFRKTANRKCIPILEIAKSLGRERAGCLTLFHSLIGCDQVSFFSICGKKNRLENMANLPTVD